MKKAKKTKSAKKEAVTISELSYYFGIRKRLVERLIMLDVLEPLSTEPEFSFPADLIPHIEKILRLHNQLGVSWSSMPLVIELLNRIEEMENQLRGR